jgi:hypothetical protein
MLSMPMQEPNILKSLLFGKHLSGIILNPQETLILGVVSALDVVMTYTLLSRGDGGFMESNPVARYFLDHWGLAGMAYFKASMTMLVFVITQFIARKDVVLARQVLGLATLIIVAVVIYSVGLHFQHHEIRAPIQYDN